MAATDTTDTTAQPAADPNAVLNAALQYLMGQRQQAAAPPAPVDRSVASLLGEAVGGGTTGLAPADRESAGTRALLNFGLNMLSASGPSTMPRSFGQVFAQGVGGAEQSLGGSEAVGASRLAAQQAYEEKQQELTISRIKEAIPLLQMLQTQQVQKGLLGEGNKPSTSIATAGDIGAPVIARDTSMTAGQQANNPGNIMMAPGVKFAGSSGAIPVSGGRYVAAFPDVPTGVAAHSDLLTNYAQSGVGTIRDAVTRWVGDPKADLTSYVADVAKAAGVGPDDKVDLSDPKIQRAILLAQQPHESGKAWLSPADVDKGLALAAARRAQAARPGGSGAVPGATAAPGAPASAPTATAPPAAPAGPPAVSPPTVATGGEAAGPGGLATRNARMTTVSPAVPGDVNAIIRGMTGAGADPTTLAPPGGPPVATVDTAGPGAPTDVQAQTKGLVVPPGVTPPPGVTATPQPPAPARVPDVFTPQPVTLPDYIQNRIDHPEAAPEIADSYRKELTTAVGPDAGKLMQQAVTNRATAIAKVKADATTEAAAYRKDAQAQQMEQWKVLRGEQQANDAATLAHTRSLETEMLKNREAQINSQAAKRDEANQKLLEPYQNGAVQAQSILPNIDLARQVLPMLPEDPSPWLQKSENRDKIASFEKYLPKNWQQSLKGADLFSQIMSGMVSEMGANLVSGQPGGRESAYEQFRTMLPSLAQSQSGRELALTFIQELAQRRIAEHEFMQNYSWDPKNRDPELHVANMGGALTAMNKPGALPPMLKLPPVSFDPTIPANSPKAVENGKLYVKYYNSVQDGGRYITYTKDGHPIARTKVAGQPPEMGED